jgi:hypothetical protein
MTPEEEKAANLKAVSVAVCPATIVLSHIRHQHLQY